MRKINKFEIFKDFSISKSKENENFHEDFFIMSENYLEKDFRKFSPNFLMFMFLTHMQAEKFVEFLIQT